MTCLPAGGSAWAREGWAKYLQHCLPWTDQAGERGLCRERTAACQTQVSGTHIRGKAISLKAVHQNMNETWVCSGVLLIIQVKCKNWNLGLWSSNDLCRVCVTAAVCLFRQRYQSLLDRIPRRLKALHTEVVAQRALDRRLTEEIHHIKLSIQQLSVYVRSDWGWSWVILPRAAPEQTK